jgi:NTE family protein
MNHNFKNLVFEGGGVKGIAYGGALDVLDQMKILPGIERVAGTSAGAITAALLALGYTSAEVSKIVAATDFSDFEDKSWFFPSNVYGLLKKYGWYKGDAFKTWMGKYVKEKTGNENFTFADLENAIKNDNEKGFRSLHTVATNLTQQSAEVFSAAHSADTTIKDAVRMSMSIPLFFQSVKNRNKDNIKSYIMVDGGVTYNYPVDLFDETKYLSNPENGVADEHTNDRDDHVFNYETLGLRLDSKKAIKYAAHDWQNPPADISDIKSYASALVNFMMETANKAHLTEEDYNRTVFIATGGVGATDFKLTQAQIDMLISNGEKGVKKFFDWKDNDATANQHPQ